MSKAIAPILARTAVDEIETQHDAVLRLVRIVGSESGHRETDALSSLYDLLENPRLGVVSKACHGEPHERE